MVFCLTQPRSASGALLTLWQLPGLVEKPLGRGAHGLSFADLPGQALPLAPTRVSGREGELQVEGAVPRPPSASGSRRSLRCFESSRPTRNQPRLLQGKKKEGAEGRDETKGELREREGERSQKGGVIEVGGS